MYELDRAQGAQPVSPSLFLAGMLVAGIWFVILLRLLEAFT